MSVAGRLVIAPDDPGRPDVRALLETHLAFAREVTPPKDVHALDASALRDPSVLFFAARQDGELLAVGALRQLDDEHGELKSMHTHTDARRKGVARAMVDRLLAVAADRGWRRVSLETGAMDAFAPSRALYRAAGFEECEPFGEYEASPNRVCMTIELDVPS